MSRSGSDNERNDSHELLRQEAHNVIERQLDTIEQTENKASSILRINLLIFGALLTMASIIVRLDGSPALPEFTNTVYTTGYLFAGIGALILSTIAAGITYTASNTYIGVSGDDLEQLSEVESYSGINQNLVTGYSLWVKMNQYALVTNNFLVTLTITLIVTGVLFLGLASLAWLTQDLGGHIAIILFGGFSIGLIIKVSGLPSLYRNFRETRSKAQETIEEYYEEIEHGGIGTLLEGTQRRNQESEVSEIARKAAKLEEWIAENPELVVGDTKGISSVMVQPSIGSGDVRFRPDVVIEYTNGENAIIEAKLSDSPNTLRTGAQQLVTYAQYFDEPELYLVAKEIPSEIEPELDDLGVEGVDAELDLDT